MKDPAPSQSVEFGGVARRAPFLNPDARPQTPPNHSLLNHCFAAHIAQQRRNMASQRSLELFLFNGFLPRKANSIRLFHWARACTSATSLL